MTDHSIDTPRTAAAHRRDPSPAPRRRTRLTLTRALFGFVALSALLFALVFWAFASTRSAHILGSALDNAVRVRTSAAGHAIGRTLHADWQDMKFVADLIGVSEPQAVRHMLDGLTGDGQRVSWAGFARPDGTVVAASKGMLEGRDVSERPWFRNGLRGDFAGDVHDAVLLNDLLGGTADNPIRFIDLALPVKTPDNEVAGVLGLHISTFWAQELLEETAEDLGIDLLLVGADGKVVLSTAPTEGSADLQSLRAAMAGAPWQGRETWGDGEEYFTTVVPRVSYEDLPSFGWRMIGRLDSTAFQPSVQELVRTAGIAFAVLALVLLSVTWAFARIFLRPIADLAASADRLADGKDDYPMELHGTAEAERLSSAIVRLQSRALDRGGRVLKRKAL